MWRVSICDNTQLYELLETEPARFEVCIWMSSYYPGAHPNENVQKTAQASIDTSLRVGCLYVGNFLDGSIECIIALTWSGVLFSIMDYDDGDSD